MSMALRIATIAALGMVAFSVSAGDAEARTGRGGPGISSGISRTGPALGALRSPGFGRHVSGGRRIYGHRFHRWPRWRHRHHRFHFFVGGVYHPGCGVIWQRRFNPVTGHFYRVRIAHCGYGYGYPYY